MRRNFQNFNKMENGIGRTEKTGRICGTGLPAVLFLLGLAVCMLAGTACKKSTPIAPIPITPLQQLINTDTTLSLYHRLILQANEAGLMNDDSVTVLMPVNAAFRAAGYSENAIDSLQATAAYNLIRYHFIPARVTVPADSGAYIPYTTLSGFAVYGMSDGVHILFNGIQASQETAPTGKAIVYRLNGVLGAPSDSLDELLGADSSLSFLAEVFRLTSLDTLLSTGNYTILAPVNSAFINAGYDSIGAIDSANPATLLQLGEYQIVQGLYFPNTLAGQSTLPTLQGSPVSVTMTGGLFQFKGGSNAVPANLLPGGNQQAGSTILVYHIDEVLTP